MSPGNPFILGSKGDRSSVGFCTLVSAGFWFLWYQYQTVRVKTASSVISLVVEIVLGPVFPPQINLPLTLNGRLI